MSVYVDELTYYPTIRDRQARRLGDRWCHLFADTLSELHNFAIKLKLRLSWFQDGKYPHYDLTPRRRLAALKAGALSIGRREWIRRERIKNADLVP